MKKLLTNILLLFVPNSKWRKLIRYNIIGEPFPNEWHEHLKRTAYGDKVVYMGQDGADVIYNELCKDKPSLICRYGTLEVGTMSQLIKNKKRKIQFENTEPMYINTGFFPITNYMLCRFASEMIEITKDIDVLGVWNLDEEFEATEKYCPDIKIVEMSCIIDIASINFEKPWTRYLKGKKILVIHPCAETIKSQYEKRHLLFDNPDILSDFDLQIIKAVQSIADEKENLPFQTWFEALEYMKEQIRMVDFDVALIGCGAYGIFLAHYCKTLGKKAVHMGGGLQILFGIKGKRWDDIGIYNEHWVSPSEAEKPKGLEKVEGGCYW